MSLNTLTAPTYEIREGRSGPDNCPCIEGIVDGQVIILAFEGVASRGNGTARHWYLGTFTDAVAFASVKHPNAIEAWTRSDARARVEFITALYARAAQPLTERGPHADLAIFDEAHRMATIAGLRELADELPREVGNSDFLSRLVDIEDIK